MLFTEKDLEGNFTLKERNIARQMRQKGLSSILQDEKKVITQLLTDYSSVATSLVFSEISFSLKGNTILWQSADNSTIYVLPFKTLDPSECDLSEANQVLAFMKYVSEKLVDLRVETFIDYVKSLNIPNLDTEDKIEDELERIAEDEKVAKVLVTESSSMIYLSSALLHYFK